jgi:hypothetical protein
MPAAMHAVDHLSPAARAAALKALVFVSWADGRLSTVELAAVRGAAIALALIDPLDGVCGALAPAPDASDDLDFSALTARERHLVLAAASWMALVDTRRTPGEARALDDVARRAGLDDETAELLFDVARCVRQAHPRTGSTWADEFERLVRVTDGALGLSLPGSRRAAEGRLQ